MIQIYHKLFYHTSEKSGTKSLNEFLNQFEDNELDPIKIEKYTSSSNEDFIQLIVTFKSSTKWTTEALNSFKMYE